MLPQPNSHLTCWIINGQCVVQLASALVTFRNRTTKQVDASFLEYILWWAFDSSFIVGRSIHYLGYTWEHINWRAGWQRLCIFGKEVGTIGRVEAFLQSVVLATTNGRKEQRDNLHTGRTTTLAPFLAASRTLSRAFARLAALSGEPSSWMRASLNFDAGARTDIVRGKSRWGVVGVVDRTGRRRERSMIYPTTMEHGGTFFPTCINNTMAALLVLPRFMHGVIRIALQCPHYFKTLSWLVVVIKDTTFASNWLHRISVHRMCMALINFIWCRGKRSSLYILAVYYKSGIDGRIGLIHMNTVVTGVW